MTRVQRNRILKHLLLELTRVLSRTITGKLLTEEQIHGVTGGVVGRYFSGFFPLPEEELEAQKRVERARRHIAEANRIIGSLRNDLDTQARQLEQLAKEIDEKRQVAKRYSALAETNQEAAAAFRGELEEALRREMLAQANEGKRLRQLASFIMWLITLVLGAALGTYFPQVVEWVSLVWA
ncbi:MAG: hypothetical protein HY730_08280 [Candidatus Tectomicrobia bacterium]|uniref:Uncharacterized protein n=1 Tax=Tectimicrobiota bacterium TaxID=2528274 RepID=A0A933LRG4_UNCTE|nr:hypothetical protein [Candidatus Tectomicrobia bacterium]